MSRTSNPPLLALLVGALAASCGPSVPTPFPRTSAASELAVEAPQVPMAVSLREDPPLPGQRAADWPGLGSADAGAGGHEMHGMDMGGMDMGSDGGHDGH